MADISKIKPNGSSGTEYDIKDATARSALENKANNTQTFTEASTRANIASGETMSTLFGKIKKFFTDLKTVAFTGSYNDLSNKPTIPAAQVQSDWNQTDSAQVDFIKNKPDIDLEGSKTATGNPITLIDASESYAEELEVTLEPIQDLHGYANPWVGGAGKNKLDPLGNETGEKTTYGITFTPLSDGTIKVNGTATGQARFYFKSNMTFAQDMVFTIEGSSFSGVTGYCSLGNVTSSKTIPANTDMGTTFIYVASGNTVNNVIVKPMISVEGGDFAPYSNICPITGYDSVKVGDVGKNLVEESFTGNIGGTGGIWADTSYSMHVARITQGKIYTITTDDEAGAVYGFYTDKPQIGSTSYDSVRVVSNNKTFTAPINGYIAFRSNLGYSTPQCELGNAATPYEPYTSSTTHTTLGRTVYDGKLNVRTGELTVDRGIKVYNGSESWNTFNSNTNTYYTPMPSDFKAYGKVISNGFKQTYSSGANMVNGEVKTTDTNAFFKCDTCQTDTEWKTYLASNNVQVCYELATPQTYQLTPAELKLLKEQNTITTNGTTISLKYQPDNVIGEAIGVSEEYTDRHFAWKKVGEYNTDGQDIVINGYYNEIMIVPFMGSSSRTAMNGVTYPFELFGTCDLAFLWDYLEGSYQTDASILKNKKLNGNHKIMVYVR